MISSIEKAFVFAQEAHKDQKRKDSDTLYIVHPVLVALILARHGFTDDVLTSALLHDTLEDTSTTYEELKNEFGESIANTVQALSHNSSLPWEEKKKAYIEQIASSNDTVKAIAVADKIANAESLLVAHEKQGDAVWKYFNASKEKKMWFEEAVLHMLEEKYPHPLTKEYGVLVERLRALV